MRWHPRPPTATAAILVCVLALALALAGCAAGSGQRSGFSSASSADSPLAGGAGFDGSVVPRAGAREFTLTDQTGRPVSLASYRGRVVILTFLSTASPSTATLIAEQIRGALDELAAPHGAQPVPALAVSLDPRADSPAHVHAFLAKVSLSGRLRYLSGSIERLQRVWRDYGVKVSGPRSADSEGSALVLLLDRRGVERVSFPVEQLTPEGLAHDIRKLQREP
jgi:protein SCO1